MMAAMVLKNAGPFNLAVRVFQNGSGPPAALAGNRHPGYVNILFLPEA
jgi:hypothetical protein